MNVDMNVKNLNKYHIAYESMGVFIREALY